MVYEYTPVARCRLSAQKTVGRTRFGTKASLRSPAVVVVVVVTQNKAGGEGLLHVRAHHNFRPHTTSKSFTYRLEPRTMVWMR